MNGTQRRETFIALRARREGYQVASEILNPHVDLPEPERRDPGEVKRVDEWGPWYHTPPARRPIPKLKVAMLILVDIALVAFCFWMAQK